MLRQLKGLLRQFYRALGNYQGVVLLIAKIGQSSLVNHVSGTDPFYYPRHSLRFIADTYFTVLESQSRKFQIRNIYFYGGITKLSQSN